MRLQLVVEELGGDDLDHLLDLPTKDSYGNDQLAGMNVFLEYVEQEDANKLSEKAGTWLADHQ